MDDAKTDPNKACEELRLFERAKCPFCRAQCIVDKETDEVRLQALLEQNHPLAYSRLSAIALSSGDIVKALEFGMKAGENIRVALLFSMLSNFFLGFDTRATNQIIIPVNQVEITHVAKENVELWELICRLQRELLIKGAKKGDMAGHYHLGEFELASENYELAYKHLYYNHYESIETNESNTEYNE